MDEVQTVNGKKRGGRPRVGIRELHLHAIQTLLDEHDRIALEHIILASGIKNGKRGKISEYIRELVQNHVDMCRGVPVRERRGKAILYDGHRALVGWKP